MKLFYGGLVLISLIAFDVDSSLAVDCLTINSRNGSPYAGSITISRQYDADILLRNCTKVIGNLNINSNYVGSLNISTVTNITGKLYSQAARLTDLSLDKLESLDHLEITNGDALKLISMPGLLTAKNLWIYSALPMDLHFPSLVNAVSISMTGNFSKIDFSNLANASISMNEGVYYTYSYTSIALSLPYLKTSDRINLYVSVYRDSFPPSPLESSYYPPPLNLSFPRLTRVGLLEADRFYTLSVPGLDSADQIKLSNVLPNALDFPSLINGTFINIGGNTTDIRLPQLTYCSTLKISSELSHLNCDSAKEAWTRVMAQQKVNHVLPLVGATFVCEVQLGAEEREAEYIRKWRLGMLLGFTLGFGIPGLVTLCCLWRYLWSNKTRSRWSDDRRAGKVRKKELEITDNKVDEKVIGGRRMGSERGIGLFSKNLWKKQEARKKEATRKEAEMNRKAMKRHGDNALDLEISKVQELWPAKDTQQAHLNNLSFEEDEDDDAVEEAPPTYEREARQGVSRYIWERDESRGIHDDEVAQHVPNEERALLKDPEH